MTSPLRVLVAPDSFKGTLRAAEVAVAISGGLKSSGLDLQVELLPLADGGEGTLDALLAATGGTSDAVRVVDTFGELHSEHIGLLADRVICIESALFCGLGGRTTAALNPMLASSYGLGQAIDAALQHAPATLLIGLGGTVTADAGLGCLAALGATCLGRNGAPLETFGGAGLLALSAIDIAPVVDRLTGVKIRALCDVNVPLAGDDGAAMFLAQKTADPRHVKGLQAAFSGFLRAVGHADRAGSGAAGGLGYALAAVGAELESGATLLFEATGADAKIAWADVVITGEGRLDRQTSHGKLIARLLERAGAHNVPVHAICGHNALQVHEVSALGLASVTTCEEGPGPPFLRARQAATRLATTKLAGMRPRT